MSTATGDLPNSRAWEVTGAVVTAVASATAPRDRVSLVERFVMISISLFRLREAAAVTPWARAMPAGSPLPGMRTVPLESLEDLDRRAVFHATARWRLGASRPTVWGIVPRR